MEKIGAEKILRVNCLFTCPQLIGMIFMEAPEFGIHSGGIPVFTDKARLYGVGLCRKKPIPPAGFLPCTLFASCAWIAGVDYRKRVNGNSVLTVKAQQICLGESIASRQIPVPIPFPGHASLKRITEQINRKWNASDSHANTERRQKEICLQIERDILSDAKKDVRDVVPGKDILRATPKDMLQSAREAQNKKPAEYAGRLPEKREEPFPDRAVSFEGAVRVCQSCGQCSTCEYLKTPCDIEPQLLNASSKLRVNAPDKVRAYAQNAETLSREYDLSWSMSGEAHHIFSKAVFAASKKLCKLANFYGYDINSRENCILLPSPAKDGEFGRQTVETKAVNAYEVMGLVGAQWHAGPHEYYISKESHPEMLAAVQKHIAKSGGTVSPDSALQNYFQLVQAERLKLERILDKTFPCCVRDREVAREKFYQLVGNSIRKIEERLLAFAQNRKDSYPYYVSRLSYLYAFGLPRSGKAILIRQRGGNWIYEKRLFHLYEKDEGRPNLAGADECAAGKTNTGELIAFCENAIYFFIEDCNMSYKPPFTYQTRLYYIVHETGVWKLYHNGNPVRLLARQAQAYGSERIAMYLLLEKSEDEGSYASPRLVVNARKRECGLL